MQCLFEDEVKAGKLVCDYGGMSYDSDVKECPTVVFNLCQANETVNYVCSDCKFFDIDESYDGVICWCNKGRDIDNDWNHKVCIDYEYGW